MAAPSVADDKAHMYYGKNFTSTEVEYKVGDDVNLWADTPHNDRFNSANVGKAAKVLAYLDDGGTGKSETLTGANPDISSIGGVSRVMVLEHDTHIIYFKFKDTTGGKAQQYELKVDLRDVGKSTLYSNHPEDEWQAVGIMPSHQPEPVTTAIHVIDVMASPNIFYPPGSMYLRYNSSTDEIDIYNETLFPSYLTHKKEGPAQFLITLVETFSPTRSAGAEHGGETKPHHHHHHHHHEGAS